MVNYKTTHGSNNDHSYTSTSCGGMLTINPTEGKLPPSPCPTDIDHVYLIKDSPTPAFFTPVEKDRQNTHGDVWKETNICIAR
jgi:hypothetical protein